MHFKMCRPFQKAEMNGCTHLHDLRGSDKSCLNSFLLLASTFWRAVRVYTKWIGGDTVLGVCSLCTLHLIHCDYKLWYRHCKGTLYSQLCVNMCTDKHDLAGITVWCGFWLGLLCTSLLSDRFLFSLDRLQQSATIPGEAYYRSGTNNPELNPERMRSFVYAHLLCATMHDKFEHEWTHKNALSCCSRWLVLHCSFVRHCFVPVSICFINIVRPPLKGNSRTFIWKRDHASG